MFKVGQIWQFKWLGSDTIVTASIHSIERGLVYMLGVDGSRIVYIEESLELHKVKLLND